MPQYFFCRSEHDGIFYPEDGEEFPDDNAAKLHSDRVAVELSRNMPNTCHVLVYRRIE